MVAVEMKRARLSLSMGGLLEPWTKRRDRVPALPALGLGGRDRQPHLLAQDAGQEPSDRMRLPAGGFHEFLPGGASGAFQQVEDLGGFAALTSAGCLLRGGLGRRGGFVSFLSGGGLLARPRLGRGNVGLRCRGPRLLGGGWRLGRGTRLGVDVFCWNAVHTSFSLGGDYRAITWITRVRPNCKLIPMRIPHGRRSGDGGELGPRWGQIGADSGRWGLFAKFGRKKERAIAALLSHRNLEGGPRRNSPRKPAPRP